MRILHVVPSYLPAWRYGGTIRSVHSLCRGLASLGHDVHVFTTDADGPASLEVPLDRPVSVDGVRVSYFKCMFPRRLYYSSSMHKALSNSLGTYDMLHLHSVFLWPTLAAAVKARRKDVPYVLSARGMLDKRLINRKSRFLKMAWINCFEKRNIEKAAAIHATSALEKSRIEEFGFRLPPVFVVPNAVEEPAAGGAVPDTVKALGGAAFVLFIGRVNWKKGLDRLILAMSFVPGTPLVIAGNDEEGYGRTLRSMAAQKGLSERILFTGEVRGPVKWALLRAAALLALPSYGENFGNVVLEAMAVRCPVVVSTQVGAADIVRETGSGCVVSGDPEELGQEIAGLLTDPERRLEMGKRGGEAATRFSERAVAQGVERQYLRTLEAKK